jgi:hypothetical protein
MKVNFLLGSGVSIPAKLPGVGDITQRVLSGDRIKVSTDSDHRYLLDEWSGQPMKEKVRASAHGELSDILRFLNRLRETADRRLHVKALRYTNYEDLAYLANQVSDDITGNRENPALWPFIEALADDLLQNHAVDRRRAALGKLATHTIDYIRDVAGGMLQREPASSDYLRLFTDASGDERKPEVNIFTLNHDVLLETYLRRAQPTVRLVDGFGDERDGVRRWDSQQFDEHCENPLQREIRLFKLHGSIDWWTWWPKRFSSAPIVDARDYRPDSFLGTRTGSLGHPPSRIEQRGRAHLLIGTFNKVAEYATDVYLEMHYRFHRTLPESDTLIVIGYSFGDKGVNQRLAEWMSASRTRRLLVVDTKALDDIKDTARGAIGKHIAYWGDRFVHYRTSVADIDWSTLKSEMCASSH